MRFSATLDSNGKTATGFRVPPDVVESFGSGKRPRVTVTINGFSYPYTIAVMGGEYLIGVSAEIREAANVKAGDRLEVELELETTPSELEIPGDLTAALAARPEAAARFNALSRSNKRRYVDPIRQAKTPETRARRVEKCVEDVLTGKV